MAKRLRMPLTFRELVYVSADNLSMLVWNILMLKKVKDNYFNDAISYRVMRKALSKCCRNVRWKDSVVGYELHAVRNTIQLINDIRDGKYKISPYQMFVIYEPKERNIVATRIRDRQFQMALCMAGLYDDITEHFIYDNCACQIGKGTDFALKRIKEHMRRFYAHHGRNGWVLKLDIHHFFPTTQHSVAKAAVRKRVCDPDACNAVCDVIDSFDGDVGIGLGSQISQLVELAVLDDLDHFIKEELHIKHYVRYMDDMVLIHEDKEYLQYCWERIVDKLAEIQLSLNPKSCLYPISQGVKMLHWRFRYTATGKINQTADNDKMGKERRRLKNILRKETKGDVEQGTAARSLEAWCSNMEKGNTFFQCKRMIEFYIKTKGELYERNNSRKVA